MTRFSLFLALLLASLFPVAAYSADEQLQPAGEIEAVDSEELPPVVAAPEVQKKAEVPEPAPGAAAKADAKPEEKAGASPVPAEPAPEVAEEPTPVHSRILPVKIKPIQEGADGVSKAGPEIEQRDAVDPDTLALYATQADGSFGPDLWKDMSRQDVIANLGKIPASTQSPAQRDLFMRLLLTKAEVEASSSDPSVPELFTVRMSKLIELGAYKEAGALYEKLEDPAPTAESALAGMQAFLGNGQFAIVCLEQKALDAKLKDEKNLFWKHLDTFCDKYIKTEGQESGDVSQSLMHASLAYTQSEKILPPAKFEDLNGRTLVELLVLSKSGTLDQGKWTVASAMHLNPSVLGFLLAMEPQATDQKLSLLTAAVASGLKSPADLEAAYKTIGVGRGAWGAFIANPKNFGAASTLKPLLGKMSIFTPAAYTPFAAKIASADPVAPLNEEDARNALKIFIAAGTAIPVKWINLAYGSEFTEESGESALLKIWNNEPPKEDKKPSTQAKRSKEPVSAELAYALILKDFLKAEDVNSDEQKSTYDNFFSLTASGNYVMPSDELTENLKKAAKAKHLGKVVLYALQVLNGQKTDRVHPAALSQVLKALKTAGLSEETMSLAREALEGLTKKKEN